VETALVRSFYKMAETTVDGQTLSVNAWHSHVITTRRCADPHNSTMMGNRRRRLTESAHLVEVQHCLLSRSFLLARRRFLVVALTYALAGVPELFAHQPRWRRLPWIHVGRSDPRAAEKVEGKLNHARVLPTPDSLSLVRASSLIRGGAKGNDDTERKPTKKKRKVLKKKAAASTPPNTNILSTGPSSERIASLDPKKKKVKVRRKASAKPGSDLRKENLTSPPTKAHAKKRRKKRTKGADVLKMDTEHQLPAREPVTTSKKAKVKRVKKKKLKQTTYPSADDVLAQGIPTPDAVLPASDDQVAPSVSEESMSTGECAGSDTSRLSEVDGLPNSDDMTIDAESTSDTSVSLPENDDTGLETFSQPPASDGDGDDEDSTAPGADAGAAALLSDSFLVESGLSLPSADLVVTSNEVTDSMDVELAEEYSSKHCDTVEVATSESVSSSDLLENQMEETSSAEGFSSSTIDAASVGERLEKENSTGPKVSFSPHSDETIGYSSSESEPEASVGELASSEASLELDGMSTGTYGSIEPLATGAILGDGSISEASDTVAETPSSPDAINANGESIALDTSPDDSVDVSSVLSRSIDEKLASLVFGHATEDDKTTVGPKSPSLDISQESAETETDPEANYERPSEAIGENDTSSDSEEASEDVVETDSQASVDDTASHDSVELLADASHISSNIDVSNETFADDGGRESNCTLPAESVSLVEPEVESDAFTVDEVLADEFSVGNNSKALSTVSKCADTLDDGVESSKEAFTPFEQNAETPSMPKREDAQDLKVDSSMDPLEQSDENPSTQVFFQEKSHSDNVDLPKLRMHSTDDPSDITVSVVTWNLAEESPSEEEAAFLRRFQLSNDGRKKGSDLVLISGQECENIKPRRTEGRRSREFRRLMIKMLGTKYVPIALHMLGGIQFGLFCRRSLLNDIEHVSVADVTCGIGNVFHNKGAIGAYVRLKARARKHMLDKSNLQRSKSVRMLFVTAHMAAHVKNFAARDADYWRIVSELEDRAPPDFLPPKSVSSFQHPWDLSTGSYLIDSMDRVFFCGDLNYRLDLPREIVEHTVQKMATTDDPDAATRLRLSLLRHDQLMAAMAEERAFIGFAEGSIRFPPTFKFDKNSAECEYDTSSKQRVPAWTDRILFKPIQTQVLEYDSILSSCHSDHRPVYATFRVGMEGRALAQPRSGRRTANRGQSSETFVQADTKLAAVSRAGRENRNKSAQEAQDRNPPTRRKKTRKAVDPLARVGPIDS
jgi:hypothetical protein